LLPVLIGFLAETHAGPIADPDWESRLLPEERAILDCPSERSPFSSRERQLLTFAYLELRKAGPLAEVATRDIQDAAATARAARDVIHASEQTCALALMPTGQGAASYGEVAQRLVAVGLAENIVADAERYLPSEYERSPDYGVPGLNGKVIRAIGARMSAGERPIEGTGNLRFAYYFCRAHFPEPRCANPIVRMVLEKNDH
jgi:hypothetical protein